MTISRRAIEQANKVANRNMIEVAKALDEAHDRGRMDVLTRLEFEVYCGADPLAVLAALLKGST